MYKDLTIDINHSFPSHQPRPDELANIASSDSSFGTWIGLGIGALGLLGLFSSREPKKIEVSKECPDISSIFNHVLECFRDAEKDLSNGASSSDIRSRLEPLLTCIADMEKEFGKLRMSIILSHVKRLEDLM